jgi:hypothetical protein
LPAGRLEGEVDGRRQPYGDRRTGDVRRPVQPVESVASGNLVEVLGGQPAGLLRIDLGVPVGRGLRVDRGQPVRRGQHRAIRGRVQVPPYQEHLRDVRHHDDHQQHDRHEPDDQHGHLPLLAGTPPRWVHRVPLASR